MLLTQRRPTPGRLGRVSSGLGLNDDAHHGPRPADSAPRSAEPTAPRTLRTDDDPRCHRRPSGALHTRSPPSVFSARRLGRLDAIEPGPRRRPAPMIRCAQCREPAPQGARFCPYCGVHLPPAAHDPTRTPARRRGLLGPAEPTADLLAPRGDLAGERKHVTVLFADVTASMALLTTHDAEEAAELFDQVVEYMVEAVRRWEGTVTQVLGDGIMALFGAPVAQEDHAIRACYAALRMQQRITAYGDEVQRTHGIPILIRVGCNSGEVVLRPLGPDPRGLSAVGQAVHVASRLERSEEHTSELQSRG